MKKIILSIMLVFVVLFIISCDGQITGDATKQDTVKIGWIGPMTGPASFLAEEGAYSAQIAVDKINEEGGIDGKKVELIVIDDQYTPKETLSAYEKLVHVDGVKYIMTVQYGIYPEIAKKAKEDGVLLFDALDCNNFLTGLGDHVFCLGVESESIARVASQQATKMGIKKVGVIYFNTDTFMPYVKDHFVKIYDGEVIAEPYEAGQTDFRTSLMKLKEQDVEAIAFFGYTELGMAMRQARELGLDVQFFGNTFPESTAAQELSGDAVEGTIYAHWHLEDKDREVVKDFYKRFEAKKGKLPTIDSLSIPHYDVVNMIKEGIEIAGTTDTKEVKKALHKVKGVKGLMTDIDVPADGGIRIPYKAHIIIKQGDQFTNKPVEE